PPVHVRDAHMHGRLLRLLRPGPSHPEQVTTPRALLVPGARWRPGTSRLGADAPPRAAGTVRRRGIAGERTEAFLRVGARSARSGRWGWSRMVPRERSRLIARRQPPSGRPPPPRDRPRGAPCPLGRVADLLPQRRLLLRPPAPLPGARG